MPYSTNKGFSIQATGSNAGVWGSDGTTPTAGSSNAINQGVTQLLDQALGGTTTLSLSSSTPITLTQAQCQNGMIRITGTLLASITLTPDSVVYFTGFYSWENVTTGNFSVTLTNAGGSLVLPQGRRGTMWVDVVTGPRIVSIAGSSTADPVPAGMTVTAYNSSTPAGYTIVNVNDYGLQVVTSGAGSLTAGAVSYSSLFSRQNVDGHTLTLAEIPSHAHTVGITTTGIAPAAGGNQFMVAGGSINTGNSGGGDSHIHPIEMRVQTAKVLLVTRN